MNSVALPASAAAPGLSAEADLIRLAASGQSEAFNELYRRHGQTAWRLAQAVAVGRGPAAEAVVAGFARALRAQRRHRQPAGADTAFRASLLGAVYHSAMERPHPHAAAATPVDADPAGRPKGGRARAQAADAALVAAAFRSLPERWRAAVWLSEVESLDAERVAPVLGVSVAVADQLIARARRGLTGRFAQARRPVPDHLGSALRSVAIAMPADLADRAEAHWSAGAADRGALFAPIAAWLNERAVRPLWVTAGGLLGLGLIGLGVVGPGSVISTNNINTPTASASPLGNPATSSSSCGVLCGGTGTTGASLTGSGSGGGGAASAVSSPGTATSAQSARPAHSTAPVSTPTTFGNTSPTTAPPTYTSPGTTTPPPQNSQPTTQTILNAGPVGSVTKSGSTTQANLLPTSNGSTATVDVGCSSGVGITIGTTTIGCSPTTTTSASPTGSASTLSSNL